MKRNLTSREIEAVDRIEGDTIILYDFSPNEYRVLKIVEIRTRDGKQIRRIKKTQNGKYLFNK
jgi:hypothetical protein